MKKILIITLLLAGTLQTFAQQDPQYSLYMFNPLGVNPAYAGSRELLSAVLVHRSQWIGLEGAPETQVLAINTPLKPTDSVGFFVFFSKSTLATSKEKSISLMIY